MFTLREATPADARDIARVHVDTWRSAYPGIVPQDFLDALDGAARAGMWKQEIARDDTYTFVVEDAGAICGFISGGRLRDGINLDEKYDSEIYTLYVLSAAQGRGAGRRLMQSLADCLAGNGLTRPVVWALEKNPWCGFYERLGGRRVAQKMIEIGGAQLSDIAYGWDDLARLLGQPSL